MTTAVATAAVETAKTTTEAKVYNVVDLERVTEKFAKLAKRAAKLGVQAPGFEVIGEHKEYEITWQHPGEDVSYFWTERTPGGFSEPGVRYTGVVRVVHHVVLTGASQVKLAGWTFLATLDHELGEDNTIIRAVPGTEGQLPVDYRHRGNACDHCKRSQARKQTYVCKHDDGRLMQVGSTCIRDFLGHDAVHALSLVDLFALAGACLDEDEMFRSRQPDTFDLVEYLSWVCKDIRENGWTSRKEAYEHGISATADRALDTMAAFRKQR